MATSPSPPRNAVSRTADGPLRVIVSSGNQRAWRWFDAYLDAEHVSLTFHSAPGIWGPGLKQALHALGTACRARAHDVVVSQGPANGLFTAAWMRLFGLRRPHLVYTFNHGSGDYYEGWRLALARRVFGRVTYFQTHSRHERRLLALHYGLAPDRIGFLPWANQPPGPPPPRPEVAGEGPYALMVGRNNRDIPLLLESVRDKELRLIIVARQGSIDGLDVPPNVTVLSDLCFEACDALIANAAIHACPIKRQDTGSGHQTIVRSMLYGVPCVLSDVPGVADYVAHERDALVVPHGDARAFGQALVRVMEDDALRARLGRAAKVRAEREMSAAHAAAHLEAVLSVFEGGDRPERLPESLLNA